MNYGSLSQNQQTNHKSFRRRIRNVVIGLVCLAIIGTTVRLLVKPAMAENPSVFCGLEEHTHDDSCYEVKETLVCTETAEDHVHTDACYEYEEILICENEEHTHSLSCKSDPSDVETMESIAKTVESVEKTGDLRKDVIAIAKTQVGYAEHTHNYEVADGDVLKGYNRYGAWYGDPYADWNTLFVSFCLHYAGNDSYPADPDCGKWIAALNGCGAYITASQGQPEMGNIIFLKTNDGLTRAGVITQVQLDDADHTVGFTVIIGDLDNRVQMVEYAMNKVEISGYFVLPETVQEEEPEQEPEQKQKQEQPESAEKADPEPEKTVEKVSEPQETKKTETETVSREIKPVEPKKAGEEGNDDAQEPTGTEIRRASNFSSLANGGNYYLSADITVTQSVSISKNTTLDLNGHTLTGNDANLFRITSGGTLNIIDSAAPKVSATEMTSLKDYGNTATYSNKTLTYYVTESAVVNDEGKTKETVRRYVVNVTGLITGNTTPFNMTGGTLNINGGTIAGCTTRAISMSGGTLNLNGGYICGNTLSSGNGGAVNATGGKINQTGTVLAANRASSGGAIAVADATYNIDGGVIAGNLSTGSSGSGGGVYASGASKVTMNAGYVTNNTVNSTQSSTGGGGIFMTGTTLYTMTGGYVTGNVSTCGGGIRTAYGRSCEIVMSGGHVSANVARTHEGGGITLDADGLAHIYGGYITNNATQTTQHWGGGGIFCADEGTMYIKDALFVENNAGGFGGGIAGCSTGRVLCVNQGSAVYNNSAQGIHLSGNQSSKSEDHKYGAQSQVFMNSGYQDFFSAFNSIVENEMLGGGSANWYGSADGMPVNSSGGDTLQGTYVMGLTSFSSEADRQAAVKKASLFVNGNDSYTHGGGILCNGYLVVGETDEIDIFARLEMEMTKKLQDESGRDLPLAGHTYSFVVRDSNGIIVSEGTNDADGQIVFDRRIPFKEEGTFTFYITETPSDEKGISYDTTQYQLRITVKLDSSEKLPGTDIIKKVFVISSLTVSRRNGDDGAWTRLSSKDYQFSDGRLISIKPADSEATFVNHHTEKTNIHVEKKWAENSEPKPITVQLYRNNKSIDKVTLDQANKWSYTWNNLPMKDDADQYYDYTVKEDPVAGYIGTYSVTNETSASQYWVPATSITAGEKYMIVSADGAYALSVTDDHYNTAFTSSDRASVSLKSGTLTVRGTTYDNWYENDVSARCIFEAQSTSSNSNSRIVFKNLGTASNSWLLVQNASNNYLRGVSQASSASGFRLNNGRLQGQIETSASNSFRYVSYSNSKFTTASTTTNAVRIYQRVSTGAMQNTVITITNTPIEETKFMLEIRKRNQQGQALPDANFRLFDSKGNPVYFIRDNATYTYTKDTSGSATCDLLITNVSGMIYAVDLPGGTYTLRETQAPPGYAPVADQKVVLDETRTNQRLELNLVDPDYIYVIPETGGSGTLWLYLTGGVLIAVALTGIIVLKRKKSN